MIEEQKTLRISRYLWGGILILFFFPFMSVSCGGYTIKVSGVQLAVGEAAVIESERKSKSRRAKLREAKHKKELVQISRQGGILMALALVSALIGFFWCMHKRIGMFAGAIGLVAMMAGSIIIENAFTQDTEVTPDFRFSFHLACFLFAALAGLNIYFLIQKKEES